MRLLWIACLTCVVLTLGLSFAHVLEVPGKLQLDGAQWLMVQHHLYVGSARWERRSRFWRSCSLGFWRYGCAEGREAVPPWRRRS